MAVNNDKFRVEVTIKKADGREPKSKQTSPGQVSYNKKGRSYRITGSQNRIWRARRHVTRDNLRRGCSLLLKQRVVATIFWWQDVPQQWGCIIR